MSCVVPDVTGVQIVAAPAGAAVASRRPARMAARRPSCFAMRMRSVGRERWTRAPYQRSQRRPPAMDDNPARMIPRYSRPQLAALWSDEARMSAWRDVEVAACEAMDGPTAEELDAIRAATFTVEAVDEREKTTDHDVAAFVDVLSASAGPAGRWIHYGLTSSDVLDTALALQLKRACEIVVPGAYALVGALATRAREHRATLCVGRTHGVHAEPTSFGLKLAGFAFEAHRNA